MQYINRRELKKYWNNLTDAQKMGAIVYINKNWLFFLIYDNDAREIRITKDAFSMFDVVPLGGFCGGYRFKINRLKDR